MEKKIGSLFWDKTKPQHLVESDQHKKRPHPASVNFAEKGMEDIRLPFPPFQGSVPTDFFNLVTERTSHRKYSDMPLTIEELSFLLWCTQGVKKAWGDVSTLRTVPSAGARHALETILYINRVQGIEKGLYGYAPLSHSIFPYDRDPLIENSLANACYRQMFVVHAAVTFLWVAIPYRMTWRYGERGYRYLLMDVGHVCQNLYLASEVVGCGACAVGAFDDDALSTILDLDDRDAFVIYMAAVGKKLEKPDQP
ncbi:MAG: SagB/ThcOx family dehydrogenase [Proteobacteria bacterium]|nr:SagB/ThcOx family dehydrogenase [Pseudomonadota bacterium]